ncbi:Stk1 family PASTA domain-containing Ser/Thr kinase [Sedimentibacter sp.]|uniref:Stk1 family PASTA domain-containing Ser/Thr kinase n=1 Tax=Sedimentibacter sp. TaxID=1960295 RepID=UPI0028AE07B1|nr:Stk1 family PASTA domain-containing Ser/Thr kinase [Sedimentibacter sp.]
MIGRILGNRYEIIEKIGGGGMSYVYKARCKVLNRFVAIKILRDELTSDPDFVNKFKQESLSAASLAHPNIVNIYDTGIEDDIYYIVMEYVKGETLKKYINRKGRLSEQEAIKISRQVAEALKHAHSNNIVHRDIKPHNILITEEGIAKVTDFGIARAATSSTINNTSNVIGSVHYFSPEQARGGYVDDKSDIYSLGIVMYEMVTGIVPFDADNHISVAMKQIQEKPVLPTKKAKNLNISKSYEDIIMKCLEKHQSFRYQNIDDLIKSLDSLNGFNAGNSTEDDEIIDSPTMVIPIINDDVDDDGVINIDLIDGNSNNAFKSFFGGDTEEEIKNKQKKENKPMNDAERNKNLKITVAAVLSALVIAVVGGIIAFKAIMYVPEVEVPDLRNRSEEEGKQIIEGLGLVFQVAKREYSSEYEEGKIMEQSVDEGMMLKENYPVEVVVSRGQKEIIVPNLVGSYAIEAGIILADAGLSEGTVEEENSDTVPAGQIIRQDPIQGTPANENDRVDYVVSLGPKITLVVMPGVTDLPLDAAKAYIIQYGLTVGEVTTEPSDTVEEGFVIHQSVTAGHEVALGTSIWLTVSSGKPDTEEPGTEEPGDGNGDGEDTGASGTYPLTITLPKNKDEVYIVVQKVAEGGREIVYSNDVDTSEQSIIINLEGKGTQVFEIYIDNELYDKVEIKFE